MCNSFSLALPAMVCFREQKGISEEVLENSFKSSCFVNLCILGDYDVFHDLVVREKELWVTSHVHDYILMLCVVKWCVPTRLLDRPNDNMLNRFTSMLSQLLRLFLVFRTYITQWELIVPRCSEAALISVELDQLLCISLPK